MNHIFRFAKRGDCRRCRAFFLVVIWMTLTVAVHSANVFFTNGSLDGPYGYSLVPPGWQDFHGTTDAASRWRSVRDSFAGIGRFPPPRPIRTGELSRHR